MKKSRTKNSDSFIVINECGGKLPGLPFEKIKEKILGKEYELDLVFVSKNFIHKLNKEYRKIDKPTDILSFPLEKKAGEIFISIEIAKKKSKEFDREIKNFITYLFIHGLVHLLGYDHGTKMERIEKKWRKFFKI